MKIAPVSFNSTPNFKGISKLVKTEFDSCDTLEANSTVDTYYYYPFADETKEKIEYEKELLTYERMERPTNQFGAVIGYDEYYTSKAIVQSPLQITQAQYDTLKKDNVSDETILKTFA